MITVPYQTIKTIDRLTIGRRELLFADLATWLNEMGRYAKKLHTSSLTAQQTARLAELPNRKYY